MRLVSALVRRGRLGLPRGCEEVDSLNFYTQLAQVERRRVPR
jgi:hypothetical protein